MREIPVPGFEGYYVTTEGQVWSERSGKFLKQYKGKGAPYPIIKIGGRGWTVHRLMGWAFLGLPPDAGRKYQVDHIDGDKSNNNLSNLRVVSAKAHSGLTERSEHTKRRGEAARITIRHEITGQELRGTTRELELHPDVESSRHGLYNLVRGLIKRTRAGWTLVESYREIGTE